jgi:hypothetical protein
MSLPASPSSEQDHEMTDAAGSNGYDPDQLQEFLEAIVHEHDELDELKSAHMLACKPARGRIKETLKAVHDAEINLTAFHVALKKRLAERKHDKRVAELEPDDAHDLERILQALGEFGDTPLGQAALARARGDDALDSLHR